MNKLRIKSYIKRANNPYLSDDVRNFYKGQVLEFMQKHIVSVEQNLVFCTEKHDYLNAEIDEENILTVLGCEIALDRFILTHPELIGAVSSNNDKKREHAYNRYLEEVENGMSEEEFRDILKL